MSIGTQDDYDQARQREADKVADREQAADDRCSEPLDLHPEVFNIFDTDPLREPGAMTTLTPEKGAELRALIPCTSGCVLDFDDDRCANEHDMCLFAKIVSIAEQKLSTEREGRKRAETRSQELWKERQQILQDAGSDELGLLAQISALQALIAEKNEALRPFADGANRYPEDWPDGCGIHMAAGSLGLGDLRRARTALNSTEAKTGEPG